MLQSGLWVLKEPLHVGLTALALTLTLGGCGSGSPSSDGPADTGVALDAGVALGDSSSSTLGDSNPSNQESGRGETGGEAGPVTPPDDGGDASSSDTGPNAGRDSGVTADSGGDGGVVLGGIRWVGRVDASNPSAVKFAWSGTGLVATITGSKISVRLQTEGATTASAFFQPVIDGTVGPRFQVMTGAAQTVVLGNALAAGDHTVELYRESEGMYGDDIFSGFVDGTVKGAPPASTRLIEIIGDSISAGYGNLGSMSTCPFSLDTQSAYQAYGSIMARRLNAEVSIIARSGWGMVRDLGGNTANVLPSIYENTLGTQSTPKWDFKRQADVVLINLGSNDQGKGDPGQPYEDAYVAFLHTVRGHYPNAWIFLTIGPMLFDPSLSQMRTHLTNVVAKVGDAKITTVDIATQNTTTTGCDYHPNVAEDNIMAGALTPAIKAKLGW